MPKEEEKMCKKKRTKQELKKASEALYYEIMMLNKCAERIHNLESQDKPLKYAVLDSFCVHLRNMIEFFGGKKGDCVTYKYFIASEESIAFPHNLSEKYNRKINNLLSHLTFERLKINQKDRKWPTGRIANEVNENILKFFEKANEKLICPELRGFKNHLTSSKRRFDDEDTCTSGNDVMDGVRT